MTAPPPPQYGDWLRASWHPKESSRKTGNSSEDKSDGSELAVEAVYTRATLDQSNLSKGMGGSETNGGKRTLESQNHTSTRNNDATLVLQAAEDQIGWDRLRVVKRNLRASGESCDEPTTSIPSSDQSPSGEQQDASSTAGQPKQLKDETHEATSLLKLKTKANPLDNKAHPT